MESNKGWVYGFQSYCTKCGYYTNFYEFSSSVARELYEDGAPEWTTDCPLCHSKRSIESWSGWNDYSDKTYYKDRKITKKVEAQTMKKYTGAQAENNEGFEKIVADGYVCKIKQAKEIKYDWGNVLSIAFDVDEGDFKGYYQKNYENQQTEDKKWKGTFRINIPTESNQYYESQKKRFNNLLFALEDSNKGFAWNWDAAEKDDYKFLAGKKIGFIFRNEEWEFNGKSGWTARAFTVKSVESIKNGKFKVPDEKPLANKPKASAEPVKFVDIEVDEEDLPF